MSDKERLQKIINDWEYGKEHEGDPLVALENNDIEWLIKQAKKTEIINKLIEGKWSTEKISASQIWSILNE